MNIRYEIWRKLYPSAPMYEYCLWNKRHIREFTASTGLDDGNIGQGQLESYKQQDGYTEWLVEKYGMPEKATI